MNRVGITLILFSMKFPKVKKLNIEELEAAKLKKEQLHQVKGGAANAEFDSACSAGTFSACHIDGASEPDC